MTGRIPITKTKVFTLSVLILAHILFWGCGKKGPPVAPRQGALKPISDLIGSLSDNTVRLTWRHSPDNGTVEGYIVLRAQSSLSKPDCPDCPMVYQKVGTIPLGRSLRKKHHDMESYHDVAAGFKYTFNVRPYQSSGAQGADSNLVVITLPKQTGNP